MDELDLIRAFRNDVPAPSPAARERALRELRGASGKRGRGPRARVVLPIAGAAAAAASAAVLLLGPTGDGLTPEANAAERLRQVAAVAESAPDPRAIGPGQFWYQRSLEAHLTTSAADDGRAPFSLIQPHVREQWIGRDGGGRVRTRDRGEPRFPGPRDRSRWLAAGSPALSAGMDVPLVNEDAGGTAPGFFIGSQQISYRDLRALPADDDALHALLLRVAGGQGERLFVVIGDLLRSAPLSSDVRGALYRVTARIPGIRVLDDVRDAAGRTGVGIAVDDGGVRSVLIYDPETGELLGEQSILLERGNHVAAAPGAVIGEAAYLEAGVVDSTSARP